MVQPFSWVLWNSAVMFVGAFGAGLLPLAVQLEESRLRTVRLNVHATVLHRHCYTRPDGDTRQPGGGLLKGVAERGVAGPTGEPGGRRDDGGHGARCDHPGGSRRVLLGVSWYVTPPKPHHRCSLLRVVLHSS